MDNQTSGHKELSMAIQGYGYFAAVSVLAGQIVFVCVCVCVCVCACACVRARVTVWCCVCVLCDFGSCSFYFAIFNEVI